MSNIITQPGRLLFEWIEIDQSLCTRTYSSAPCAAILGTTGQDKCYNTRASCQDPDNYDGTGTLTLYFCKNQGYIPDDHQYEPYLVSATISPAKINPGGGNTNMQALGIRSTLSVTLADHPHTDVIVDPYVTERDYDPYQRSTFWAKWKARNPYYMNRVIRHKSGYIDPDTGLPDPDTLITRTYFITNFTGPSSNNSVSIQAKDILALAANEKAKAPFVSTGKLSGAITDVDVSLTLTPTGIGDLEYGYSGNVRIGREIIAYTRSTGSDTLSLTRAQNNTLAESHSDGDSVQECLIVTAQTPASILELLLTTYASIDSSYLDLSQWATETADFLPRTYTALITEPTGVTTLINEMCEQMYFTTFWDDRSSLLKLRAVRPVEGETVTELNDDSHLLENSITWVDKADELITQVWVYYTQIDPTEPLDKKSNYAALDVTADPDAEGSDRNDESKVKVIYARWITSGAAATELGEKILARYNHIPKECSFKLDAKDRDLWLADFIRITNRNNVDFSGMPLPVSMQITSAQESQQGTTYSYTAIEYAGGTIENETGVLTVDISYDLFNCNLLELFKSEYATTTPISGDRIRFKIRSGVVVGGLATSSETNILASGILPSYTYKSTVQGLSILGLADIAYLQRRYLSSPRTILLGNNYTNAQTAAVEGVCGIEVREYPLSTALKTGDTESGPTVWPNAWPAGVIIELIIEPGALLLGEGGSSTPIFLDGLSSKKPVYGGDGGHAIEIGHPINISNYGIIAAGGGAGSGVTSSPSSSEGFALESGGAGAGSRNGYATNIGFPALLGIVASGGSNTENGYGVKWLDTIKSGDGGGLAENGKPSFYLTDQIDKFGVAGDAIVSGTSNITWVNKGTVVGAEN